MKICISRHDAHALQIDVASVLLITSQLTKSQSRIILTAVRLYSLKLRQLSLPIQADSMRRFTTEFQLCRNKLAVRKYHSD